MASADFCLCISHCCQRNTRFAGQRQISPGKPCCLHPNAAGYTSVPSAQVWGFTVLGQLNPERQPLIRFVFLGSGLPLHLPSHPASRRRSWLQV